MDQAFAQQGLNDCVRWQLSGFLNPKHELCGRAAVDGDGAEGVSEWDFYDYLSLNCILSDENPPGD
ncbi:MAG TPA: hypothetical protein VMT53_21385 [Terriglobales bacterium]|nr:hypothetical protein [Terriglobales bacterium]